MKMNKIRSIPDTGCSLAGTTNTQYIFSVQLASAVRKLSTGVWEAREMWSQVGLPGKVAIINKSPNFIFKKIVCIIFFKYSVYGR